MVHHGQFVALRGPDPRFVAVADARFEYRMSFSVSLAKTAFAENFCCPVGRQDPTGRSQSTK
jgi:hypothetical protein